MGGAQAERQGQDEGLRGRVAVRGEAVQARFTDGIGTPDPNPRQIVSWCF